MVWASERRSHHEWGLQQPKTPGSLHFGMTCVGFFGDPVVDTGTKEIGVEKDSVGPFCYYAVLARWVL